MCVQLLIISPKISDDEDRQVELIAGRATDRHDSFSALTLRRVRARSSGMPAQRFPYNEWDIHD